MGYTAVVIEIRNYGPHSCGRSDQCHEQETMCLY